MKEIYDLQEINEGDILIAQSRVEIEMGVYVNEGEPVKVLHLISGITEDWIKFIHFRTGTVSTLYAYRFRENLRSDGKFMFGNRCIFQ